MIIRVKDGAQDVKGETSVSSIMNIEPSLA